MLTTCIVVDYPLISKAQIRGIHDKYKDHIYVPVTAVERDQNTWSQKQLPIIRDPELEHIGLEATSERQAGSY